MQDSNQTDRWSIRRLLRIPVRRIRSLKNFSLTESTIEVQVAPADRHSGHRIVALTLFLLPYLIYWPVIAFPYALMDDNWLLRGWTETGYPTMGFMSIIQGRPTLMLLAGFSSLLFQEFGEVGIQLLRATGIGMLGLGSVLTYRYAHYLPVSGAFRILAAALWMTLPSVQVIVANGIWLTAGIAAAIGATLVLFHPLTWPRIAFATVLLWIAATTYQACFFVAPALYLLTLVGVREWLGPARRMLVMVGAFGIYFVAWALLYKAIYSNSGEARYNPGAILDPGDLPQRIVEHIGERLWLLSHFWDVPTSFPSIRAYVQITLVAAAFAALLIWLRRHRFTLPRSITELWPLVLFPAALLAAETAVLPSRQPISSYTTAIGSMMVTGMAVSMLLSYVAQGIGGIRRAATAASLGIVVLGSVLAAISVTRHFALPAYLNMREVARYATQREQFREADGTLVLCFIGQAHIYYTDSPAPAYGYQEFSWANMAGPFYAHWHSRLVLDLLGLDSTKLVTVLRDAMGVTPDQVAPAGATAHGRCAPDEFLDLSLSTKHNYFR